jgi:hypothetical protein
MGEACSARTGSRALGAARGSTMVRRTERNI